MKIFQLLKQKFSNLRWLRHGKIFLATD